MVFTGDGITVKYLTGKTYKFIETLKVPAAREVKVDEFNEFRNASYTSQIDNINKALRLIKRASASYKSKVGGEGTPTVLGVFDFLVAEIAEAEDNMIMAFIDAGNKHEKRLQDLKSQLAAIKFCLHLASVHNLR